MSFKHSCSRSIIPIASCMLAAIALCCATIANGQKPVETANAVATADDKAFQEQIQPLFKKDCMRCHSAEEMESGIRVDQLSATPEDRQIFLLNDISKQLTEGAMPPPEEPQPSAQQRQLLTDWITRTVTAARARNT